MILAALNLHFCIAGALYRPIEMYHRTNKKTSTELQSVCTASPHDVQCDNSNIPNTTLHEFNSNFDCQRNGSEKCSHREQSYKYRHVVENDKARESEKKYCHGHYKEYCIKLWTSFLSTFDPSLFKNVAFVLVLVCAFGHQGGSFAILAHIVKRGGDYGITSLLSSSLPAIMGLTQLFGRIFWGVLGRVAHKIKPTTLFGGSFAGAGVVTVVSIHTTSYTGQLIFAVLFGVCMACYTSIFTIVIRQIVGIKHLDSGNMFYLTVLAISPFLCAPFVGWLRDIKGNYDLAFYLIAGMFLTSATCAFLAQIVDSYKSKKKRQKPKEAEHKDTYI
ncbi:monocarboxylate transporter 3-like [Glandiceps talaboti]